MLKTATKLVFFLTVVRTSFAEMTDPGDLALVLNEDDFEDYLENWLEFEEYKWGRSLPRSGYSVPGCTIEVNGDLGQPQPVYLQSDGYVVPTDNTGQIHLNFGEQIYVACTGSNRLIQHPNITASTAAGNVTCMYNALISADWVNGTSEFGHLTCSGHSNHEAQSTGEKCFDDNLVIRVGFVVDGTFYPLYWSCFDQNRLEVLYVWYEQNPPNSAHQIGVDRPSWLAGSFFPGVGVNNLYTQARQKTAIASLVGQELADKYVTSTQYMSRGHLAAKTDFIFATGQRATFYFINSAPQWQPFNAGNWNWVEQNLRARIGDAGYSTTVYTGTFGVSQLRDQNDSFVDLYLHTDANNNPQLPVPLYYYKVVYEPTLRLGTAFVSINSPYYTLAECRALTFCTDRCRNNAAFNWLRWQPDRIDIGYSFCCSVDDFRRTVRHLPAFAVNGLLT